MIEDKINNKLTKEAKDVGLELLGTSKKSHYRLYKFKECGHHQEIHTSSINNKQFKCKNCFEAKLAQEAKDVDLELLGSVKNFHYRLYKFKKCGHEQEIQTGHVRNKNFKCQKCNGIRLENNLLVKSYLEKSVGDWLNNQGIEYIYEKKLSLKSNHKTDFYLVEKDIYIEVAGFIEEVLINNSISKTEMILELEKDPKNYKGYTDKLINKIKSHYEYKSLIILTAKNLNTSGWEEELKSNIELIERRKYT